jgi:hypothetical protein
MRADEIGDVNVVADAGSIRRVVVRAEDGDVIAPSSRGFERDL